MYEVFGVRSPIDAEVVGSGQAGRDVLGLDPDVRVGDAPVSHEFPQGPAGDVDRDREADPFRGAGARPDLGVDPDHARARVEQRPPGVAVVDGSVDLDCVGDGIRRREGVDLAPRRRNDADAQRRLWIGR